MNPYEPHRGGVYLALKSNGRLQIRKGQHWVHTGGDLRNFTTRSVTVLLNPYECLETPGLFAPAAVCPFCEKPLFQAGNDAPLHDGYDCARAWDAKVKKYCLRCGVDLEQGECPMCGGRP